jgi:ABC-type dipeptide/oligopeptide/nickel transport system permease subunit
METAWWMILYPGFAIFVAVFSYNILGEGLRDHFNPKLKR